MTSALPFFSGVVPVTLALTGMTCGVPCHTMRLPLGGTPVLPLPRTRSFLFDWTTETETMAWKPGSQVAVTESRALAPSTELGGWSHGASASTVAALVPAWDDVRALSRAGRGRPRSRGKRARVIRRAGRLRVVPSERLAPPVRTLAIRREARVGKALTRGIVGAPGRARGSPGIRAFPTACAELVGGRPGGGPSFAMEWSANDEVSECCTSEHGHGD